MREIIKDKVKIKSKVTLSLAICRNCNKEFSFNPKSKRGKFCSNKCNGESERKESFKSFLEGKLIYRGLIKKVIIANIKDVCYECGLKEWQNKPLTLELDHIDGNASNNMPDNLRLLCPNCHSQTDTYCGKNKGKGRKQLNLKH